MSFLIMMTQKRIFDIQFNCNGLKILCNINRIVAFIQCASSMLTIISETEKRCFKSLLCVTQR